jgi:hypothetical protein
MGKDTTTTFTILAEFKLKHIEGFGSIFKQFKGLFVDNFISITSLKIFFMQSTLYHYPEQNITILAKF